MKLLVSAVAVASMALGSLLALAMDGRPAPSSDDSLARIAKSLEELVGFVHVTRQAVPLIQEALIGNADVQVALAEIPPEQRDAAALQMIINGAINATIDLAVLTHRLRQDSDLLREQGLIDGLSGIDKKLGQIGVALQAIPAMATEMHVMNRQIAPMANTSGKIGSWMPW